MKLMKALPIFGLLLVLALAACVPATAVPEQQAPLVIPATETPPLFSNLTPFAPGTVPTSVPNPLTTPLTNATPVLPTQVIATPFVQTEIVQTPLFPTFTPAPTKAVPNTGAAATPGTFVDLVSALSQMNNVTVQQQGAIQQPYFDVKAQLLSVNGQQVQVFEFNSVSARQEAESMVSSTGSSIGGYIPSFVSTPHFWSSGQMLVLYVGQDQQVMNVLTDVLGAQVNNPLGVTGTPIVTDQTVSIARQYLANLLGVNINQVELVSVQQEQWPNACLGLPQTNESCAQVLTPGYQVLLRVNGQLYQVRTDTSGQQIRITQGESQ